MSYPLSSSLSSAGHSDMLVAESSSEQISEPLKNTTYTKEASQLILSHVFKTGVREEWIREDEDDAVFLWQYRNNEEEILCYPKSADVDPDINSVLSRLQATCAVVTKPSSVRLILQNFETLNFCRIDQLRDIPIFNNFAEVKYMGNKSGCFLLRDGNRCFSYGSAIDVINIARQIEAALVSAAFSALQTLTNPVSSTSSISHYQHNSISRAVQRIEDQEEEVEYINEQQALWLSTLKPSTSEVTIDNCSSVNPIDPSSSNSVILHENGAHSSLDTDCESEEELIEQDRRPTHLSALLSGLGVAVNMCIMALFSRDIVVNTLYDGNYTRLALLVAVIPRFFVSQFFCDHIILILAQLFFPISQMHQNSLYYSGKPSKPLPKGYKLPHFTVQMPCYKEGLQSVLAPSLKSVKAAVEAYKAVGGTANVIISEDGLRSLEKEEAEQRMKFYNAMGCAWVARPAEGTDNYKRLGRFKKASNLNYTYTVSLALEDNLEKIRSETVNEEHSISHDRKIYADALEKTLAESNNAWANGDIRIGDYLLLIDSDTRVPENCLLQAANELERSPDVAALQHCSGITYVQNHYFERLLGYFVGVFTNFSISWVCANGAMAPLMGHNVFLRWKALQHVVKKATDKDQGEVQIFSSYHVSEDYELAMRLQLAGYYIRWATYSNQEFREGVSLNPNDEKTRWQKYAFGACELIFNPLKKWYKGPIDSFFLKFLWSRQVRLASKLSALSYLSSYFALGISIPMLLFMTVMTGLYWPSIDTTFKPIFDTWIAVVVVFNLAGAIGLMTCRARSGNCSLFRSLWDSIQHLPAIIIFFSGITYHVAISILAFFFSFNMTWSATSKDYQQTSLSDVVRRFWHCYLVMAALLFAAVISMSNLVPFEWRIEGIVVLFPVFLSASMHILFPILLDPGILHKFIPRYYSVKADEGQERNFFYGANQIDSKSDYKSEIKSDAVSSFASTPSLVKDSPSFRSLTQMPSLAYLPQHQSIQFQGTPQWNQSRNGLSSRAESVIVPFKV